MSFMRKDLFKLPSWVKPELAQPIYYVHLGILAVVVLGLLQWLRGGNMLTLMNVLLSIPLLTAGDFLAHTLLKLD